jgi:undecaprenyl-diphosphatase
VGIDYDIYKAIDARGPHAIDEIFRFLANDLVVVMVAIVALLFLFPWQRLRVERRRAAVLATMAAGVALLVNQPIANAVDRARPYVAHPHDAHLLIARSPDPSFPSDHASGAFALATMVWTYDRTWGAVLLVLAVILGFARVYAGAHYPFDVVGGAAIGAAVALILRIRPIRTRLEAIADWCARLWDAVLARVLPSSRTT